MASARLILGTAQLGMAYGVANQAGRPPEADARAILSRARQLGVCAFDTSPLYGEADKRLGAWLAGNSGGVEITTKLPHLVACGATVANVERHVEHSVQESLVRLGLESVDRLLVHSPDDVRQLGRSLSAALTRQREAGRVRAIGASVYNPEEARLAGETLGPLDVVQFPFNLLDTRMWTSGAITELNRGGVLAEARSAYLQGVLVLREDELPGRVAHVRDALGRLNQLLGEHRVSAATIALAFVVSTPGIDGVVFGVDTEAQLEANVAAAERAVPDGLLEQVCAQLGELPLEIIEPRQWRTE